MSSLDSVLPNVSRLNEFRKTIYRKPPPHFYAEAIPPQKIGKTYLTGLRICPLHSTAYDYSFETDLASPPHSQTSGDYIVWRTWEDCLQFQSLLETEYATQAREKCRGLVRGKGVKKNGIYMNSDLASSFDSLPFGPDPTTIAKDVHSFLPKLTKKDSLFGVSQATVEQRYEQFAALIDRLFQDDLPTLGLELRDRQLIRDFFGYWNGDKDYESKQLRKGSSSSPQKSPNNPWSWRFSSSALTPQQPKSAPGYLSSIPEHNLGDQTSPSIIAHQSLKHSHSRYTISGPERPSPTERDFSRPTPGFHGFGDGCNLVKSPSGRDIPPHRTVHRSKQSRTSRALPMLPTERQDAMEFTVVSGELSADKPSPVLRFLAIPMDDDLIDSSKFDSPVYELDSISPDDVVDSLGLPYETDTNVTVDASFRCSSIFPTSRRSSLQISIADMPSRRYSTLSNCTASSASSTSTNRVRDSSMSGFSWFTDVKSTCTKAFRHSRASMNSVMTNSSVDRIIPHEVSKPSSLSSAPSEQVPEGELWSAQDYNLLHSDLCDPRYPPSVYSQSEQSEFDASQLEHIYQDIPGEQSPEPCRKRPSGLYQRPEAPQMESLPLQSPTTSSKSSDVPEVVIKVLLAEDAVASFRLPIGVLYDDVCKNILDKLIGRGSDLVSRYFVVAYLARGQADVSHSDSSYSTVKKIQSEEEWREAVDHCGGELSLRIVEFI